MTAVRKVAWTLRSNCRSVSSPSVQANRPSTYSFGGSPSTNNPLAGNPTSTMGVRLNIRPFMADDIPGGRRGAGILRSKPNIHWRKDRGREPAREVDRFPWFWSNGEFTGDRVNDVNLSPERKRYAQGPPGKPR